MGFFNLTSDNVEKVFSAITVTSAPVSSLNSTSLLFKQTVACHWDSPDNSTLPKKLSSSESFCSSVTATQETPLVKQHEV